MLYLYIYTDIQSLFGTEVFHILILSLFFVDVLKLSVVVILHPTIKIKYPLFYNIIIYINSLILFVLFITIIFYINQLFDRITTNIFEYIKNFFIKMMGSGRSPNTQPTPGGFGQPTGGGGKPPKKPGTVPPSKGHYQEKSDDDDGDGLPPLGDPLRRKILRERSNKRYHESHPRTAEQKAKRAHNDRVNRERIRHDDPVKDAIIKAKFSAKNAAYYQKNKGILYAKKKIRLQKQAEEKKKKDSEEKKKKD